MWTLNVLWLSLLAFGLAVAEGIKINKLDLSAVSAPESSPSFSTSLKYPNKLEKNPVFSIGDKLSLTLKTEPAILEQVFLVLKGPEVSTTFVFNPEGKKGTYTLELEIAASYLQDSLKGTPGTYSATIYLSDPSESDKISYAFGSLQFNFPKSPQAGRPSSDSPEFQQLPPITHIFRPKQSSPPAILSYLFSILVISPWPALVAYWLFLGANISRLFSSKSMFVFGLSFIACIGSFIALFYCYWLTLTIFQLLGYGLAIAVPTVFVGRKALVSRTEVI